MKTCNECHRLFSEESGFCPIDGLRLVPLSEAVLPSDPNDPRVGRSFCGDRYQIWRVVADGGMGRVYQALDLRERRGVALKILHSDVASDSVSLERFRREFELSNSLKHTHIVEVLGFERTEDDSYALVMEYLEGEELRMLLKREKSLPPERLVRMLSQVALGLETAHERGIVHRDLKPDNIFLCGTHDGDVVKILDFGSVRDNSAGAKKLTMIGTTIGSPYYMAPEQAQGLKDLDHRADVWSMAAILYECLTGTVPFSASTGPAILLAILTKEPPPPSEAGRANGVPKTLDPVFEEALTKNAKIRTPTIAELADRFGRAYGLTGSHRDWASLPEQALKAQLEAVLPGVLSAYEAERQGLPDGRAMDEAFGRAQDAAGPSIPIRDDLVMGVPARLPRWLVPTVGVIAVLLGIGIALAVTR